MRSALLSGTSFLLIFSVLHIYISGLYRAALFTVAGFRIINLVSRLPTKANNWDSITVITINRGSSALRVVINIYGADTKENSLTEEEERKTEGAAAGVMLYNICSGRSKPEVVSYISI